MTQDARQLYREGKTAEALVAARAAHDRNDPQSGLLLGMLCVVSGATEEAERVLTQALASGAGEARHWSALAAVRAQHNNPTGEADALQQAVALAPGDGALWLRLAAALLDVGQRPRALEAVTEALKYEDSSTARRAFAEAVQGTDRTDPALRAVLKRALAEAWANPSKFHHAAVRMIAAGKLAPEADDLLAELLSNAIVQDPGLEQTLTAARRRYLLEGGGDPAFIARLADQCRANEYCWMVSSEEAAALRALDGSHPLRALYEERAESVAPVEVPVLTPVHDNVSQVVQAMYEENPYPRWLHVAPADLRPLGQILTAMFPHARLDPIPGAEVLVAGCGTGQHAVQVAQRYQGSTVLAVDLSRAALAYAMRKTAEAGVPNIAYGQADLLELGALGRRFDVIECSGTLHHLRDPAAGLRVLTSLLKPGGVIKLGLYSRRGRLDLEPAMRLAKSFEPSREGIRALRQAIMNAAPGDPVRAVLSRLDFYATSMVRDLLMHVQEKEFDVPGLGRLLGENGLRLVGFTLPPEVRMRYRQEYPQDPGAADLGLMDAFEARYPETFRGMYQFWCQKPLEA